MARRLSNGGPRVADALRAAGARRTLPAKLLADDASRVARACYEMAVRFHGGGRLVVFGSGRSAADAQHIAVEFVHPVIVGKRALPAFSLANDVPTLTGVAGREGFSEVFAHQLHYLADRRDIALGVSADGNCANVLRALETANELGMLTIALTGGDGGKIAPSPAVDHAFAVRSDEPEVVKEVQVTTYHILWELVHVFFEQPGMLDPEVVP
jgi:D-sedoheptulose 7-phosphate isomerase